MSLLQWAYVEREKGKLKVDERTDAALTEAVKNGLQVVMTLDKGNWLYAPTPRVLDPTRDLMETYASSPAGNAREKRGWDKMLLDYPPQFQGYLDYVRFMVRHFKSRVKIFEIWNEWQHPTYPSAKNYARVLREASKVIREEDPQAKIMPSSPGWNVEDNFGWFRALGDEGLLKQVDVIGFHPFYDVSPVHPNLESFPEAFNRFKKLMEGYGFKGQYMATEWLYSDPYPAEDFPGHSEIQKAVYGSRLSIEFAALGITNFWNETFQTMSMSSIGLLRNAFSNEVISPTQPEAVYYMLRTLSTALEAVKGADVSVTFSDKRREVTAYGFERSGGEKLVAFWLPGLMRQLGEEEGVLPTDVVIKGVKGEGATIIDVLNGTEQPLRVERTAEGVVVPKVHVQDWPLIIRLPN
jgi:hypothetical protein